MRPSHAASPSPAAHSFAGLLTDFVAPEKKLPPARDLDGLADDVATLTYESALRTHARYRPAPAVTPDIAPVPKPGSSLCSTPAPAEPRKSASVTVRLTSAEDEQLRLRAAEAGITVSAYLRSCAFEVESLRAQVKDTLAELRQTKTLVRSPSAWHRILPWLRKPA